MTTDAQEWMDVSGWHKGYDEHDARTAAAAWAEAEKNITEYRLGMARLVGKPGSREHQIKATYEIEVWARFREPQTRGPKPRVEYDGNTYTCKAWKVEIPDFDQMDRTDVLFWLLHNTIPQGYSKPKPLAGLAGVVGVSVRGEATGGA